ncbi:Mitochondrial mRNA pseudouridine synthase Trub2 [Pseudolycoriella hygida]|uniref:Mitochondrial mRNA pseudouridine synthase Trub2 n=1 Tax=Pseudolycoriella hygida TaxID=35572 RepID=A0A9Q0RX02_9DIPT|nr:Mitochondrial mRNA pseudouridine synthase Trub2 [Pseudolycoriella hygida]
MQHSKLVRIKDSSVVWNCLNGVINVFKPVGISVNNVKCSILGNLCKDLNSLETRPPRDRVLISSKNPEDNEPRNDEYKVEVVTDWSDHVLAAGQRHQICDFKFNSCHLSRFSSGVLLVGLNGGTRQIHKIKSNRLIRVYHVTGELGKSTENNFPDSVIIARAHVSHIWPDKMTSVLSSMQASHQKKMFEFCGVDIQSNAAFEIAKKGLIRPTNDSFPIPVLYGIKCVKFERPKFTVEIHAINEDTAYLGQLIQEIGLQLRSVAHCTGIRCIRYGHFTVEDSLLRGNWHLQNILSNMAMCRKIIGEHPSIIKQKNIELANASSQ